MILLLRYHRCSYRKMKKKIHEDHREWIWIFIRSQYRIVCMYWYDCTYLTYEVQTINRGAEYSTWYRTRFIPALLHSKSSRQKAYSHSRVQIELKVYSKLRVIQLTFTEFLDILLFSRVLRMQNRGTDYSSVCIVRDTRLHFSIYDQCSNKCCSKHTVGFKI